MIESDAIEIEVTVTRRPESERPRLTETGFCILCGMPIVRYMPARWNDREDTLPGSKHMHNACARHWAGWGGSLSSAAGPSTRGDKLVFERVSASISRLKWEIINGRKSA